MKLVPRTKPIDADDNIGRGMDFALVILVFLGIGWALDRAFDTRPAFMIGCTVFSVVGQFVRMWYAYDARMSQLESERTTELRSAPRASVMVEDLAYAPLVIPTDIGRDALLDGRIEHADGRKGRRHDERTHPPGGADARP